MEIEIKEESLLVDQPPNLGKNLSQFLRMSQPGQQWVWMTGFNGRRPQLADSTGGEKEYAEIDCPKTLGGVL